MLKVVSQKNEEGISPYELDLPEPFGPIMDVKYESPSSSV